MRFEDRRHAGRLLAEAVVAANPDSPLVLALPRGGVPVGYEVSRALDCPLDLMVVKKIGVPGHRELAMGAVANGDVTIVNHRVVAMAGVDSADFETAAIQARQDLQESASRYRNGAQPLDIAGTTAIVVDDGLATGATARAAITAARARDALMVWLAIPVAPPESVSEIQDEVDELIVIAQPRRFIAVGNWYADFHQTSDAEVIDLLTRAN